MLGAYSSRLGNGTVGILGAGQKVGGYYSLDIHVVSHCTNTFSRHQAAGRRSHCAADVERILACRAHRFWFVGGRKKKTRTVRRRQRTPPLPPNPTQIPCYPN